MVEHAYVALARQVLLEEAEADVVEVALVEGGDGALVRQRELQPAGLGGGGDGVRVGELWVWV